MILFDTVTKKYPRTTRPAVDAVSLEVERGEFVFVVGQSGSGKSTLLRLALKEENATSGSVFVAGRELSRLPDRKVPQLRREIGTVFQDFRLLPNKTVFQNVAFALQVIGKSRSVIRQTVPETLRVVGLEGKERRLPHELSGGEQQRVAIARAIVNKPAILLADEPTGNLDPGISLEIVGLLDRINRSGTTIVMATHDLHIVNAFHKRVIELRDGRVVRDDAGGEYNSGEIVMPVWDTRPSLDALDAVTVAEATLEAPETSETAPRPADGEDGDDLVSVGATAHAAAPAAVKQAAEPTEPPAPRTSRLKLRRGR